MLLPLPVGVLLVLAFLAGLATPPFEAARSAALPDLVPEERYGEALALAGISVQSSLVVGYALGGAAAHGGRARVALAINAASFLVSAILLLEPPPHRGRRAGRGAGRPSGARSATAPRRSSATGWSAAPSCIVAVTGALGTVGEALVVPYGVEVGLPDGPLGLLAAAVPVGTLLGTAAIASGHPRPPPPAAQRGLVRRGHLGRAPRRCSGSRPSGAFAFVAFAIAGGMFAVSIPTNTVIGMRLSRDTRASAMGIAVGVLMGSQALGAAVGGIVASAGRARPRPSPARWRRPPCSACGPR